jgi:hypothetical protein
MIKKRVVIVFGIFLGGAINAFGALHRERDRDLFLTPMNEWIQRRHAAGRKVRMWALESMIRDIRKLSLEEQEKAITFLQEGTQKMRGFIKETREKEGSPCEEMDLSAQYDGAMREFLMHPLIENLNWMESVLRRLKAGKEKVKASRAENSKKNKSKKENDERRT